MRHRLLGTVLACLSALALSASAVLAAGPTKVNHGSPVAATHGSGTGCSQAQSKATDVGAVKPTKADKGHGKPTQADPADDESDDSDIEEVDQERPQNHGWFVSQVAMDHSVTGREHGDAVSDVARSDQGKPDQASH